MVILLKSEEWSEWKNNQATLEFFRFLEDRRQVLANLWAQGTEMSHLQQGSAMELTFLSRLEPEDIATFYDKDVSGDGGNG